MNTQSHFLELLDKYTENTLLPAEERAFISMLQDGSHHEWLSVEILDKLEMELPDLKKMPDKKTAEILSGITGRYSPSVHRVQFLRTAWFRYAAIILLIAGITIYSWLRNTGEPAVTPHNTISATDIAPGKDAAILTLSDGTRVRLDSLSNGFITSQNGTRLVMKDGQLAYDPTGNSQADITYNLVTTPKGRQFHIQLPDGTKVWLNAASSIRYPTVFSGKERNLQINGEAYFEVEKNPAMPFLVNVNNQATVEVLGTSFNINAYEDQDFIRTTLLEGSVRVIKEKGKKGVQPSQALPGNNVVLKPGQQAQINNPELQPAKIASQTQSEEIAVVNDADVEKVMAWKNGIFDFNGLVLKEVMSQLSRWYDIEIVYEGRAPDIRFYGKMSRGVMLSDLLKLLEQSEVHFRLEEGRRLVILP